MLFRLLRVLAPWLLWASLGALACDISTLGFGSAPKPLILVQSPAPGTEFHQGDDVTVQTTSTDPNGIVRVELSVDGTPVQTAAPPIPQGQVSFTVIQKWQATPGTHTLSVRAFNVSGTASDPALVAISVVASSQPASATSTPVVVIQPFGGITPTLPPLEPTSIVTTATATATTTTTTATTATATTPIATTATATIPIAPSATRTPTTRPRPTNTLAAPPGVYALSIRVDPPAPRRGQAVGFLVTFLNTTGVPQGYQWRVRIFEPDKRNSFGDTAPIRNDIPLGTTELPSVVNWGVFGPTGCRAFIARVFWIDPASKNETEFLKPDGSGGPSTTFPLECP